MPKPLEYIILADHLFLLAPTVRMLQWPKPVEKISCLGTCLSSPHQCIHNFVWFFGYNLFLSGTYSFRATWISFSGHGHLYLTQNEPPLITWGAKHGFASLTATRLILLPIYITVLWSYDWKQPKCNVKVLFQSSGHSQRGSVTQKKKIVTSVLREKKPQILIIWLWPKTNGLFY